MPVRPGGATAGVGPPKKRSKKRAAADGHADAAGSCAERGVPMASSGAVVAGCCRKAVTEDTYTTDGRQLLSHGHGQGAEKNDVGKGNGEKEEKEEREEKNVKKKKDKGKKAKKKANKEKEWEEVRREGVDSGIETERRVQRGEGNRLGHEYCDERASGEVHRQGNGALDQYPEPGASPVDTLVQTRGKSAVARAYTTGAQVQPAAESRLVYVGGLPFHYQDTDVRAAFADCGPIEHVHCMKFKDTGKFRGIALITFASAEAAERAKAWDGVDWDGRFLVIKEGRALPKNAHAPQARDVGGVCGVRPDERPKPRGSTTAYVGNLNFETTEVELRSVFAGCDIAGVRFATEKETGRPKGFAFVEFANDDSLERGMQMNGMVVRGRELAMHYSTTTGPSAKTRQRHVGDAQGARYNTNETPFRRGHRNARA